MKLQEWQKGNDSKIPSMQRVLLHDDWLKELHIEVENKIEIKIEEEDSEPVGFIQID